MNDSNNEVSTKIDEVFDNFSEMILSLSLNTISLSFLIVSVITGIKLINGQIIGPDFINAGSNILINNIYKIGLIALTSSPLLFITYFMINIPYITICIGNEKKNSKSIKMIDYIATIFISICFSIVYFYLIFYAIYKIVLLIY